MIVSFSLVPSFFGVSFNFVPFPFHLFLRLSFQVIIAVQLYLLFSIVFATCGILVEWLNLNFIKKYQFQEDILR